MTNCITAATKMPSFLPFPRFLLPLPMTQTAKLLYALLLDRAQLSRANGWADARGQIYILFPVAHMAAALGRSPMTVKTALKELEKAGLIARRRQGPAQPNRVYIKLPEEENPVLQEAEKPPVKGTETCPQAAGKPPVKGTETCPQEAEKPPIKGTETCPQEVEKPPVKGTETCPQEAEKPPIKGTETCPPEGQKKVLLTDRNLSTNNLRSNLRELPEGRDLPRGRCQNVFLSETEVRELDAAYPGLWQEYVERLSEYMASTGRAYRNHAATIRRWIADDRRKGRGLADYSCEEGESL